MNDQKLIRYETKIQNNPFFVIDSLYYSGNISVAVGQEDGALLSCNHFINNYSLVYLVCRQKTFL